MNAPIYYKNISLLLRKEFNKRQNKNKSYSLRAFARDLKTSPSAIYDYLNENKKPSVQKIEEICKKLKLCSTEVQNYTTPMSANEDIDNLLPKIDLLPQSTKTDSPDTIKADLLHFAFYSLSFDSNDNYTPEIATNRLGIDNQDTSTLLKDLISAGLITQTPSGKIIKNLQGPLRSKAQTPEEMISAAKKNHNSLSLYMEASIKKENIPNSSHSTMIFKASSEKIQEAKNRIKTFKRELASFLSECEEHDEIMALNINLFPFPDNCSEFQRTVRKI